jgi:1,2-diacylglycerol 3-beta-galactosyltransferase
MRPVKVLILTVDIGFGHRAAAKAIAAALEERYAGECELIIVNPLEDDRAPSFLRDSQEDYDRLVREMPEMYRIQYQIGDLPVSAAMTEGALTVMLYQVFKDLTRRHRPDVVVATQNFFPAPLAALTSLGKLKAPFVTVVTDLTKVQRMWLNDAASLTLVPTQAVYQQALDSGLHPDQVRVTGIPVNPAFLHEQRSKEEIRAVLGWRPDMVTVLVVGSKRVKNLEAVMNVFNHSGFHVQWVIVTGGDEGLFSKLQQTEWHGITHLYNLVSNMPSMMRAADCVVTKAGGLITTEALASGLPVLLVDVTPGQEEPNAEYVVANEVGERADTPTDALVVLYHWLEKDGKLLAERAQRSKALGRADSAFKIADMVMETARRGPLPISASRRRSIPRLRAILKQFGVAEG